MTGCLAATTALSGCSEEKPPVAYAGPTIRAADLGAAEPSLPPTGFVLLEERSEGRFPCGLAVARLDQPTTNWGAKGGDWELATTKEEMATWWNQLFNNVALVREVLVMDAMTMPVPEDGVPGIVQAAQHLRAGLVLIYGPADAPHGESALTGVVRDTETGKVLAVICARIGPEDFTPHRLDTLDQDQRHIDPDYLVARQFEQQVRQCVIKLLRQDVPVLTTQPSPWKEDRKPEPTPVYVIPNRQNDW
jgi:hypothetical protein